MKDIYEVLRQKQRELEEKRTEVWALMKVVPMLMEAADIPKEPVAPAAKESGS